MLSKLKVNFGYSAIQSLKIATIYPILGILGLLYGLTFLLIFLPVLYLFPQSVEKIASWDDYLDSQVKALINNE